MIFIAIKESENKTQIDSALSEYFTKKAKPIYKFINYPEKFSGWTCLLVDQNNYEMEKELIEYLSQKLQTIVFGYEYQDITTGYSVYLYSLGKCVDELTALDYQLLSTYGYFTNLDDLSSEEKQDFDANSILESYYEHIGIDPNYIKLEDEF